MAMREGNHAEAILLFRAAAQFAPDEAPIELALIEALRRAGRIQQAKEHAQTASRRWPRDADVWLAAGAVYRDAGRSTARGKASGKHRDKDFKRAIDAYRRAVRLAPDREAAYLGLADAQRAAGQRTDALATYRSYTARAPDSVTVRLAHAQVLIEARAFADAAIQLRRVVALDFAQVDGYRLLAHALRFAGRDDESLEVLRGAFARSGDARIGRQLVGQLAEAGARDEALSALATLAERADSEDELLAVGDLYLTLGVWTEAAAVAERAGSYQPISGHGDLLRARALVVGQRSAEAIESLLAVSAARAAFPECRALAARWLADSGQLQAADAALAEALAQHPHHRALIIGQAYVLERRQHPGRARAALTRALAARPGQPQLLHALARLHHRQGQTDRAIATMDQALAEDPDDIVALKLIGRWSTERGADLERARRLLKRAVRLAPGDASLLGEYGWALFKLRRQRAARRALERAALIFPHDAELLYRLGEAALAERDSQRGRDLLQRARALDPDQALAARIDARLQGLARSGAGSSQR